MSGICDRCNERSSHMVNIAYVPELASVAHLGYRNVCPPCYDDLLAEASGVEEQDEDRRAEPRATVSIKAQVNGNTAHLDNFSDEMTIVEISPSGLRLHTARELDPGAVVKIMVPSHNFEAAAIVQVVWREAGERNLGLKLVEPSDGWDQIWKQYGDQ